MARYLQQAFNAVCQEAKPAESWYVCLVEEVPYYGGPEEGGWWGRDTHLVAFQKYPSEELARAAESAVRRLANDLAKASRDSFGDHCLREMDWLDERGLDADFLPEPDGPTEYIVYVSEELPQETRGSRHYE